MPATSLSISFDAIADFDRSDCHALNLGDFFNALSWKSRIVKSNSAVDEIAGALRARLDKQYSGAKRSRAELRWSSLWNSGIGSSLRLNSLFAVVEELSGIRIDDAAESSNVSDVNESLAEVLEDIATIEPAEPIELILLLDILQNAAPDLSDELVVRTWQVALIESLAMCSELPEPDGEIENQHDLLMRAAEVPLLGSLTFADVKGAAGLRKEGVVWVGECLDAATDTDGMPHSRVLPHLRGWLGGLTRCLIWAEWTGTKFWTREAAERFEAVVCSAVAMSDGEGRLPFDQSANGLTQSMLSSAAALTEWKPKTNVGRVVKGWSDEPVKDNFKRASPKKQEPPPTSQSDWAEAAYLRSHWFHAADRMVVGHHGQWPMVDLACAGVPMLMGDWHLHLKLDGKQVDEQGEWYNVCWFSDSDSDYAELQWKLEDGTRIERQLFLARKQQFAIFSDCITTEEEDTAIEFISSIPLFDGIEHQADPATREIILDYDDRQRVRVFPLALDQDRIQKAIGDLSVSDGGLRWEHQGKGGAYAPVILDWNLERRAEAAVWNPLTVTEDRRVLTASEASGFRVRLGDSQYVLFRSNRNNGEHRAVLGCHTTNESIIGKFSIKTGEVQPLVFVE